MTGRVSGTFVPAQLAAATLECIQLDLMHMARKTRDPEARNEFQRLEAKCNEQRRGLARHEVKFVNQEAFAKRDFLEDETTTAPRTPAPREA